MQESEQPSSNIEQLGIVDPNGQEIISAAKQAELDSAEDAKRQQEYAEYMARREAMREKDPVVREDIRNTLDTLRGLLTMTTPYVETERKTREGQPVIVPVRSFPISTLQMHKMQMVETELVARIAELAYKL